MLRIDVVTIFPGMFAGPLDLGIVQRARSRELVQIEVHDLREQTTDKHRRVDDKAFGGGPGMVMKVEPFCQQLEALLPSGRPAGTEVVLLSPRGRRFDQPCAERFAGLERLVLLCGRYEGVDERVREAYCSDELSLGDFVLTGGETAALAVIEATVRLLPGALGDEESALADSFADGLLDYPHYTRPAEFRGLAVPEVLLSGDHGRVARWRREQALLATLERRPELLERAELGPEDRAYLRSCRTADVPRAAAS